MALLAALLHSRHVLFGFTNADLTALVAALEQPYSHRQATYDLRRLLRRGIIVRLRKSHRYQITPFGRRVAVIFTKTYGRVITPGLALIGPGPPEISARHPVARAWRDLDHAFDDFVDTQLSAVA